MAKGKGDERSIGAVIKTALKILLACFAVGWVLSLLDLDALDFLRNLSQMVRYVVEQSSDLIKSSVKYILLGAIVVVPIALINFALNRLRGRKSSGSG